MHSLFKKSLDSARHKVWANCNEEICSKKNDKKNFSFHQRVFTFSFLYQMFPQLVKQLFKTMKKERI